MIDFCQPSLFADTIGRFLSVACHPLKAIVLCNCSVFSQYTCCAVFIDFAKHDNVLLCDGSVADGKKERKVVPRLNVQTAEDPSPV